MSQEQVTVILVTYDGNPRIPLLLRDLHIDWTFLGWEKWNRHQQAEPSSVRIIIALVDLNEHPIGTNFLNVYGVLENLVKYIVSLGPAHANTGNLCLHPG